MREHSEHRKRIIEDIDFLRPATEIVYGHHEKWTGGGYPRNLSGEDIPLGARIFTFADVFDALSTERSHKSAWTTDEVLSEIHRCSGTHFDPTVVEHFEKQLSTILAVLELSQEGHSISDYVDLDRYS